MEVENITKAAAFKGFFHLSYKSAESFFLTALFNIFIRQTLKNMNEWLTKI